jgi:hypothetical protein
LTVFGQKASLDINAWTLDNRRISTEELAGLAPRQLSKKGARHGDFIPF